MIYAFIDKPVPHITIHRNLNCGYIHRQTTVPVQRLEMHINLENLSDSLLKFKNNEIRFGGQSRRNCFWLMLDLGDFDFEMAVVARIMIYLGERYSPLANLTPRIHC